MEIEIASKDCDECLLSDEETKEIHQKMVFAEQFWFWLCLGLGFVLSILNLYFTLLWAVGATIWIAMTLARDPRHHRIAMRYFEKKRSLCSESHKCWVSKESEYW